MTTTTEFEPGQPEPLRSTQRPQPLNSLVAAAKRLTKAEVKRLGNSAKSEAWQEDAWDMHDLVGEQRFLAHTLAGRLSQARFFAGRLPDNSTEDVEVLDAGPAVEVLDSLISKGAQFAQIIERAGVNLFIPGDCYLIGVPPEADAEEGTPPPPSTGITPIGRRTEDSDPLDGIDLATLDWTLHSVSEVTFDKDGNVSVKQGEGRTASKTYDADDVMVVRIWRPHPRYFWQADSPTRSSLPVLRELVGLTMHISAQVDSRLAGAGVFLIPESADRAVRAAAGVSEDDDEASPFAAALMEAMITPISDRSSASAIVPVMPVVPDDSIEKFRYISFAGPLDQEARSLRDEAIRRLALGQDCPPELLLGVGGMNHWGAWLVREDVVTTHLEPPLALICDALTTQFLWPVLMQQGMSEEEAHQHVVWYDVDHMIMRPDRSKDAKDLHSVGAISDATLRDATGFDESDAPEADPTDPAVVLALDLVRGAPSLLQNPGLDVIVRQIRAMLDEQPIPALPGAQDDGQPADEDQPADDETDDETTENGPPATDGADEEEAGPPAIAASGNPVMDAIVGQIASGRYGPLDLPAEQEPKREGPIMLDVTHGGGGAS